MVTILFFPRPDTTPSQNTLFFVFLGASLLLAFAFALGMPDTMHCFLYESYQDYQDTTHMIRNFAIISLKRAEAILSKQSQHQIGKQKIR